MGYKYHTSSLTNAPVQPEQDLSENEVQHQSSDTGDYSNGPVTSASNLPKIKSVVKYKISPTSEWEKVEIVSRGGKMKGQHWHFLNVKPIDGVGGVKYVSFRDDVHDVHGSYCDDCI